MVSVDSGVEKDRPAPRQAWPVASNEGDRNQGGPTHGTLPTDEIIPDAAIVARIRTIKPELAQDQMVGSVSRDARLCWILCFPIADDEGRFRAAPALIASQCFPYDGLRPKQVEGWLADLESVGLIFRYAVDGQDYAVIPNFAKHQVLSHFTESRLPAPPEGIPEFSGIDRKARASRASISTSISTSSNGVGKSEREGFVQVFDVFRERHPRAGMDEKRRQLLGRWVKERGTEFCVAAVRGVVHSPHHMGVNDTGTVYDSLELIFRDAKHAELFAGYELDPATRPKGRRESEADRTILAKMNAGQIDPNIAAKAWRQGRPLTDA